MGLGCEDLDCFVCQGFEVGFACEVGVFVGFRVMGFDE